MVNDIWSTFTRLIDICVVWVAFYYILKNVRNNIKMALILKGCLILLVVKFCSEIFHLYTVGVLLEYLVQWGPLAIIIIFQPEIRNILESVGRTQLLGRHKVLTMDEREKIVFEIMKSVDYFSKNRIGALMVIEREISLQSYIDNASPIYADLTEALLETIFFPNSPLHDGALVIRNGRIEAAGCILPLTKNEIGKELGTRHRAAVGMSEISDALIVVVSEETGAVSFAKGGELTKDISVGDLREILIEFLTSEETQVTKRKFIRRKDKDVKEQSKD